MNRMTPTNDRLSRLFGWLLVAYWLAIFSGTHYPQAPRIEIDNSDKILHFSGYFGLAFLLMAWRLTRRAPTFGAVAFVVAVIVTYGALDEITQPLTGRDCDLLDWVADVAGTILGASTAAVGMAWWRRQPSTGVATISDSR